MLSNGLKSFKETKSFQYTSPNCKVVQCDLHLLSADVCTVSRATNR
jgi:hypothetical protein